ncbi:MAG: ribosomal large subunit pseudouridine synthase rRNA synthase [Candidatus Parcubacteria bacterium]|jgi:23S rRNA pseudouridine1911/1915/1917 synthase
MDIKVIVENSNYIIINKPAGISVHKSGQREEYTISDWVIEHFPQTKEVGEPLKISNGETIERHGIVHRLDKDTSGVLLIALTQKAYEFFKKQFHDREIKKSYRAFLYGNLKEDHLTIQEPIGKHKKDFRKRTTARNSRGELKPAITFFHVLQRAKVENEPVLFVEAQPKTGRTHQIRVHARYMQHPVVADTLYARSKPKLLGFERLALHAYSLEFKDLDGFTQKVEADFPEDFRYALSLVDRLE